MKISLLASSRPLGALFALGIVLTSFLADHPATAQGYTYTVIYNFGSGSDGKYPQGSLMQGTDGIFRGTTTQGGTYGYGTLFKMSAVGSEFIEANFNDTDGADPISPQIEGTDGYYYGTALAGGTYGGGDAYKFNSAGTGTILHYFNPGTGGDGGGPYPLIQASDGNFYGTCNSGGADGDGTIFKMTSSGTVTVLHSFGTITNDGENPVGALIQASDGNFYGTTEYGGAYGYGTVFKATSSGIVTILHSFGDSSVTNDGKNPVASLIQGADGNLYGTTGNGGADSDGTVFKITTGGTETVLHSFAGYPSDGANPYAGLVQAASGNLYGTTFNGGDGYGTVFMITTSGTESVVYSLYSIGEADGAYPYAGLIIGNNGILYGTAEQGGAYGYGVMFSLAAPL